jgi:hypothetical protein
MRRPLVTFALASLVALAGCAPRPVGPSEVRGGLARAVASAIDAEARDAGAYQPWLDVLAEAAASSDDPSSVAATAAALDALAHRDPPSEALVYRQRETFARVVLRMREIWEATDARRGAYAPLVAGLIARSMHTLALTTGEARGANVWAERRGCAPAATTFGPVDSAPLGAIEAKSTVPARGPMPAALRGLPPFSTDEAPTVLRADTCVIDTRATGGTRGLREAVVDLRVDGEQDVTFALTTDGPASLEVGGQRVLLRSAEAGEGTMLRFARAHATGGVLRAVVRVADRGQGASFELDAWGQDGFALASKAPAPGDTADATVKPLEPIDVTRFDHRAGGSGGEASDAALAMLATAELALGEGRAAFRRLDAEIERAKSDAAPDKTGAAHPPRFWLVALRALEGSDEISDTRRTERARDAARRVLDVWPDAWEAKIADARSAADRRGPEEGPFIALDKLGIHFDPEATPAAAAYDALTVPELAFIASVADGARLRDVAERAFTALAKKAPGSLALARVDAAVHDRAGDEAVRAACEGGLSRATTTCFSVRRLNGDLDGALAEIERLRTLRSAPDALRDLELAVRIDKGDLAGVLAIYDGMPQGQRTMLPALGLAAARGDVAAARARLARDASGAGDSPQAIAPLLQLLEGGSPEARRLEAEGRDITDRDRKNPAMKGAATAVLKHVEHYGLDESGLLHFVVYDMRRVGGTTDVDQNAAAALPFVEGRGTSKLLRRRVIKKDGRVLHPDAASMASQGNTDLSQLETGDYVEQIVEGYYLPNDQGHIVLDTPDLLPERTSVLSAEIVVRVPEKLALSIWAHPRLGSPAEVAGRAEKRDGYAFHTFRLDNAPPRRLEDDVPQLERGVRISLGTLTWAEVARGVSETIKATEVRDPYVARFAREAAGLQLGEAPRLDKATLARVVSRVGDAIKEPHPFELTDMGTTMTGQSSIRAAIEDREGSRTTIVARSLQTLGFDAEIAIAEPEPFATTEAVPPHTGRFRHPLIVVHLPGEDVWIDADLRGAPLPPGQVSSELRGRGAILASGRVVPVQGATSVGGDEIDLKLVVDAQGDAKGTLVATIRGRAAQALNDAFQQVVGSEQKQMLRTVVLGWVPWADVDEVTIATDAGAWQLRIRADIAVSGFARPEGKDGATWVLPGVEPVHYVFPRPYATTLGTTYTAQRERSTALSIEWPLQFVMTRTITLPPNARVSKSPAAVEVSGSVLRATRKSAVKGNEVIDEFRLDLPTGTVAAEAYPAFARDVQAVDSGFLSGTRVEVGR